MSENQKFDRVFRSLVVKPTRVGDLEELWARTQRRRKRRTRAAAGASTVVVVLLVVGGLVLSQGGPGSGSTQVVGAGPSAPAERTTRQGVSLRSTPLDHLTMKLTVDGLDLLGSRTSRPLPPFGFLDPAGDESLVVTGAAAFLIEGSPTWLTVISVSGDGSGAVLAEVDGEIQDVATLADGVAYLAVRTREAEGEPVVTVRTDRSDGSPASAVTFFPYVRGTDCATNPGASGPEATVPAYAAPATATTTMADGATGPRFVAPLMTPCPN